MERFTTAHCPRYHRAVEIIGRRWSGAILQVMLAGATRFGEIRGAIPEMSDKMLTERLRELEVEGLVERVTTPGQAGRAEYHLTPRGRALEPVVASISHWAQEWLELEEAASA